MPQFTLHPDKTLLVDGPSSILAKKGSATILGASFEPDDSLTIPKYRRVPIETKTSAVVEAALGPSASFRQVSGSSIPPSWETAAEALYHVRGIAVILGGVDAGKSTLCTYLANGCSGSGLITKVVDADIGQADIGPPTTTSASTVTKNIFSLQELEPTQARFIGTTSPSSVENKHIQSIVQLTRDRSNSNAVTIVNTDGWMREQNAVQHKQLLLNGLRPDLILGLSTDHDLDTILDSQTAHVLRLEPSRFARTRTREERKRTRDQGYKRFLQNSSNLEFRTNKVQLRMYNRPQQQRIDQGSSHKGTIAGLLDTSGDLLSIGRILSIQSGRIRITAKIREQPPIVELGGVVVSSKFEEVGFEP